MSKGLRAAESVAIGVLLLGSIGFVWFGVLWLAQPKKMAEALSIVLSSGDAVSDARAVYGGLELGVGLFLAYCSLSAERRAQGLVAALFALAGLGLSRLAGIVLENGAVTAATWRLLATDLGSASLVAVVWLATRRRLIASRLASRSSDRDW